MSAPTSQHSRWEPVDLVQYQIVSVVAARQQSVPRVMFKGGTLFRVCDRRDWRFSEDLDFDWIHPVDTKPAIQDFFDGVLNTVSRTHQTAFG
ncbi:MAG: nucleotidyl transferase AbiEii/AbiGii toxin family protein [Chloroflexota bacterium]|nr:nucleotidyl transferase AbiEii/AbiGii toxin family protein [Chloroflexota bacterium]